MNRPVKRTMVLRKCSQLVLVATFAMSYGFAVAEERDQEFQLVELKDRAKVITMPVVGNAVPGSYLVGNTEFTVERHEDNVKFQAITGSIQRVQWVSDTDEFGRFVYNEDKKRFERLTHSVRLVLEDYKKLPELVEEAGATSGKAFPELDFAIVNLPKKVHPLKFSKAVEERENVKSATIEVETPRQVPL